MPLQCRPTHVRSVHLKRFEEPLKIQTNVGVVVVVVAAAVVVVVVEY